MLGAGVVTEYTTMESSSKAISTAVSNEDTLNALLSGLIRTQVWNKIFRASLFDQIRFPNGRAYEDVLTTYKLLGFATVAGVQELSYHYIQRNSSISQSYDIKNLEDYWIAHKQRYEDLKDKADNKLLLRSCASAISRCWVWYCGCEKNPEFVARLSSFTREHFQIFGDRTWPLYLRLCVFIARFNNPVSFYSAYVMNKVYGVLKPKYFE